MKPFIGIDITENKKNEKFNGEEFIVKTVSQIQKQTLENAQEDAFGLVEESKIPLPLRIIQGVCGVAGVLCLSGIMRAWSDITISQCYQNAPWLFWVCGTCLVTWAILKILSVKKQKETLNTDTGENVARKIESVSKGIYSELDVPETAETVDILAFTYKIKDGEPKAKETGFNPTPYINVEFKAFIESDKLILADLENKYAFPLSSLKAIHKENKHISALGWNKEEDPKKGKYKEYKLGVDDYGCVHFKPYYILEVLHNGESWGVYFPSYELTAFTELTGLTPQE